MRRLHLDFSRHVYGYKVLQLNPPIHVTTPLGEGDALIVIDYGCHINTVWMVWLFETGAVSHFDSSDIRIMGNMMYGIPHPEQPTT